MIASHLIYVLGKKFFRVGHKFSDIFQKKIVLGQNFSKENVLGWDNFFSRYRFSENFYPRTKKFRNFLT